MHKDVVWYFTMNYLTGRLTWFSIASSPFPCLPSFFCNLTLHLQICNLFSKQRLFFFELSLLNNLGLSGFLSLAHKCFCAFCRLSPLKLHSCVLCAFPAAFVCEAEGDSQSLVRQTFWWGASTQGKPEAYEVHDALSLAIAAHILACICSHFFSHSLSLKPS